MSPIFNKKDKSLFIQMQYVLIKKFNFSLIKTEKLTIYFIAYFKPETGEFCVENKSTKANFYFCCVVKAFSHAL